MEERGRDRVKDWILRGFELADGVVPVQASENISTKVNRQQKSTDILSHGSQVRSVSGSLAVALPVSIGGRPWAV